MPVRLTGVPHLNYFTYAFGADIINGVTTEECTSCVHFTVSVFQLFACCVLLANIAKTGHRIVGLPP
jgi:hypothetical protein